MGIQPAFRLAALAALLIAFSASPADSPANPPNLLPNGSFEDIVPATNLPKEWNVSWGRKPAPDPTVACDGKRSLKLQFQGPHEEMMTYTQFPIKVEKATTCRISFQVRMLDLDGCAYVYVYRYPTMEEYVSKKLTGTNDWQKVNVDIPLVPAITSLQVRITAVASWGEAWFDKGEAVLVEGAK